MNPEELAKLIRQYLAGELDDRAMHLLEKQALDDPFLAEALEGYEKNKPDQRQQLTDLNEQLNRRVASKPSGGKIVNLYRWAAAAAIIILMGLSWWIVDISKEPVPDIVAVPSVHPESKDSGAAIASAQPAPKSQDTANQASDHTPTIQYTPAAPQVAQNNVPAAREAQISVPTTPQLAKVKETDSIQGLLQGRVSGLEVLDSMTDNSRNFIVSKRNVNTDSVSLALNGNINFSKGLNEVVLNQRADSANNVVIRGYNTTGRPADKKARTTKKGAPLDEITNTWEYKAPVPSNGAEAYAEYLKTHVKNPKQYEGTVKVTFLVMPDGTLQNIKIKSHLNKECDEEALRLIKEGPAWLPASDGKPARVTQKVKFSKEN
jgi:TonB family protein